MKTLNHKEISETLSALKWFGYHIFNVTDKKIVFLSSSNVGQTQPEWKQHDVESKVLEIYKLQAEFIKTDITNEVLMDYFYLRQIEGRGLCGMKRFIFTTGLAWGISQFIYEGRYCFPDYAEAERCFFEWDGKGDPEGEWIKYKGVGGERSNPNFVV
jgi:hypothetical protein